MLRFLLHRTIRRLERRFAYDAAYMHELIDASPAAMLKFSLIQPMNQHRKGVPKAVWYAARITAASHEDCGPCTQLVVDMAYADGVAADELRAVAARDFAGMSDGVALAVRLADAVAANEPADAVRDDIVGRFGMDGLISLSLGIAGARVFPTLKRSLGHARMCEGLQIEGEFIAMQRTG